MELVAWKTKKKMPTIKIILETTTIMGTRQTPKAKDGPSLRSKLGRIFS